MGSPVRLRVESACEAANGPTTRGHHISQLASQLQDENHSRLFQLVPLMVWAFALDAKVLLVLFQSPSSPLCPRRSRPTRPRGMRSGRSQATTSSQRRRKSRFGCISCGDAVCSTCIPRNECETVVTTLIHSLALKLNQHLLNFRTFALGIMKY